MKSKNILGITGIVLTLFAAGCDYVDQPYQNPEDTSTEDCPAPVFEPNTNTQRSVLLEEFTGFQCAPCPGAAKTARDLEAAYTAAGKSFIIVAIHAGGLAEPEPAGSPSFTTEYRTPDGNYIADNVFTPGLPYTPVGFINRIQVAGSPWIDHPDWQTHADAQFALPLVVNLQAQVEYDAAANKGCLHVESEAVTNLSGDYYMVAYMLEDSIMDWQYNASSGGDPAYPAGTVSNYYHRHVFRDAITPVLGVQVFTGSTAVGQKVVKTVPFTINAAWHKEHIGLVVYVYDAATKEVMQVIEKHLEE